MNYRIDKQWTPHAVITAVAVNIATTLMRRSKRRSNRKHWGPRNQKSIEAKPERSRKGMCRSRGNMANRGAPNRGIPKKKKQLKMLRTTGEDLAGWLFESGKRRRRLPTTEVKQIWTVLTTTAALLQLKKTKTTRATRRIMTMLDPMTRALLLSPTSLEGAGGVQLKETAARRAVRLQKRAHQRPQGEGKGQGCVYAWFGEGFLYIGYAPLRRGGTQNELAGPAYRWQEHLVNHARGHSRSRQAQVQNGKEEITRRTAIHDIANSERARGTTDGEYGDRHNIAERKRTKNHETERRSEKKGAKKTTEIQRKGHDSMCLPRNMGSEKTAKTKKTRHDRRHGHNSDQVDLAKLDSTTESSPMGDVGRSLVVEEKLQRGVPHGTED